MSWAELPVKPAGHYKIWRCLSWLDDDGCDETGEVEVCGVCVPKHSSFRSRGDVPGWPLHKTEEEPDRARAPG